ncbi:MAG: toxic anion resistance protein [Pseudomonadota bacterium]
MSDSSRTLKPEQSGAVSSPAAAEPAAGLTEVSLDPQTRNTLLAELDLTDSQSIIFFGVKAQRLLSRVTRRMMKLASAGGPSKASQDLDDMLAVIRQFQPDTGSSWLGRLLGSRRRRLLRDVAEVVNRIDAAAATLERRKTELLTEVVAMDRLLEQCREALTQVARYEKAGRYKLAGLKDASSEISGARLDELLGRCEDLSISHVLAQQALATLLTAQHASKGLLSRVGAVLDQTVPAWQLHMSQLLALWRGEQINEALDDVKGMHGELDQMSEQLAAARAAVRGELASGRRDTEALAIANQALAEAVTESAALAHSASEAVSRVVSDLGAAKS